MWYSVFEPYIGRFQVRYWIALEDPMKGVYFLIFIFGLQQFDGNILGPKILNLPDCQHSEIWHIFCSVADCLASVWLGVPICSHLLYCRYDSG